MPEDVRAKFKSICALEGASMSEKAVQLINAWIEEKSKEPAKKEK